LPIQTPHLHINTKQFNIEMTPISVFCKLGKWFQLNISITIKLAQNQLIICLKGKVAYWVHSESDCREIWMDQSEGQIWPTVAWAQPGLLIGSFKLSCNLIGNRPNKLPILLRELYKPCLLTNLYFCPLTN